MTSKSSSHLKASLPTVEILKAWAIAQGYTNLHAMLNENLTIYDYLTETETRIRARLEWLKTNPPPEDRSKTDNIATSIIFESAKIRYENEVKKNKQILASIEEWRKQHPAQTKKEEKPVE